MTPLTGNRAPDRLRSERRRRFYPEDWRYLTSLRNLVWAITDDREVRSRIVRWCRGAAVRVSLLISPWPAALLMRKVFAAGVPGLTAALDRHAPANVTGLINERYGADPDMLLDVFRPASATGPLPLVVWVHGGGFVGGTKDELAGYFKLVASHGFAVAAPRYSLAPGRRYPTPPRQLMQALQYLQANAGRLLIDPDRIALAGDSAGAHIAAQAAALVTTPGYAEAVGITPTITPAQLRGLVLACGLYDLRLVRHPAAPAGHLFVQASLQAYSGHRRFFDAPAFAAWSITDHVSAAFPPALITVGNADPLRPHSELLAAKLQAHGAETETLFFPAAHQPPADHEYQFDLDTDAGQLFLDRLLTFLRHRLAAPAPSPGTDPAPRLGTAP
jgi:acetyl esterase